MNELGYQEENTTCQERGGEVLCETMRMRKGDYEKAQDKTLHL